MKKNYKKLIGIFCFLILLIGCTSTKIISPESKISTKILFTKNSNGILYYSEHNYDFKTTVQNQNNYDFIIHHELTIEKIATPVFPYELLKKKDFVKQVILNVHINESGKVESVIIKKSGGLYLDNNSIKAVLDSKFKSASNGKPFLISIPYTFKNE